MSAANEVSNAFSRAQSYAASASSSATSFVSQMQALIYTPPTIDVSWTGIAPPSLSDLPAQPAMPNITYTAPGGQPGSLSIPAPTINIDQFTEVAPTLDTLVAPEISYGVTPTVPSVGAVTVPTAPVIGAVTPPTYLSLSTPTFGGFDIHADYLANLESIPALNLVEPTPYSYTPSAQYTSSLLTTLKSIIESRLAGGTGLNPVVEEQIWDRTRTREVAASRAFIDEATRNAENLGFHLPSGVLAAQIREAQGRYSDKLQEASREIAIKQAELEQENLKQAVSEGQALEAKLIDYSLQYERIAFESAKALAENSVAIYNTSVEAYKALLSAYQTYATAYRAIIDGEIAKVQAFKAEVDAELAKAEINKAKVEQYKAEIQASLTLVEIYKAQVGGAQTLVELEKTKIMAAGEQIKAYVAQVNAETAKIEAYKAQVQGQQATVEIYATKARAFSAKVGAQAEQARAELGRYQALHQAKSAEWDGYKTKVAVEGERIKALGMQSQTLLDAYKVGAAAIQARAEMETRLWEGQIKEYEASQQLVLQTAKVNNEATMFTNQSRLDAAKTGAQVMAQLAGSAYNMAHAQASISGNDSYAIQYSYGGSVSGAVSPATGFGV